jgi:hypothetical protein
MLNQSSTKKFLWHYVSKTIVAYFIIFSRHINKLSRSYYLKFWSTCNLPNFLCVQKIVHFKINLFCTKCDNMFFQHVVRITTWTFQQSYGEMIFIFANYLHQIHNFKVRKSFMPLNINLQSSLEYEKLVSNYVFFDS